MTEDDNFILRLMRFGLNEKEAQVYFHLLKYGPKTPSPLAKSLKTYREDVHRTLASLIEKGMVRPAGQKRESDRRVRTVCYKLRAEMTKLMSPEYTKRKRKKKEK
jgi:predicted transcriptional regulator